MLECEFGVELFYCVCGYIVLMVVGEMFFFCVQCMFVEVDVIWEEMGELVGFCCGCVCFGVFFMFCISFVVEVFSFFYGVYFDVDLYFIESGLCLLVEQLVVGVVDIVFVMQFDVMFLVGVSLMYVFLFMEEFVVVFLVVLLFVIYGFLISLDYFVILFLIVFDESYELCVMMDVVFCVVGFMLKFVLEGVEMDVVLCFVEWGVGVVVVLVMVFFDCLLLCLVWFFYLVMICIVSLVY